MSYFTFKKLSTGVTSWKKNLKSKNKTQFFYETNIYKKMVVSIITLRERNDTEHRYTYYFCTLLSIYIVYREAFKP